MPTEENPADDATRFSKDPLQPNDRWFKGPSFLHLPESEWPIERTLTIKEQSAINELEMRKGYVGFVATPASKLSLTTRLLGWPGLLVLARRVLNIFNRWKSFTHSKIVAKQQRCRAKMNHVNLQPTNSKPPLAIEITRKCVNYWYRRVQMESFGSEVNGLQGKMKLHKESKILSLQPYLDMDGVMRANGRVKSTFAGRFNENPIILDGKHFAITALIQSFHRRFFHGSNNTVLNELRQDFQIVGLRKALLTIASRCIVCRIKKAKPFTPAMGNLPLGRMAYRLRPFTHSGLDLFGPLLVKIGRRREKRWGALFTCLTTRAIHVELVHSLTADSAIMAIQRLAARRGVPMSLYCDNGSNFHKAEKDLKEAVGKIDQEKVGSYARHKNIDWHFNPPEAPFMGGCWERLIRCVKVALYTVLNEQAPREEVLLTLLAEVEHSVNSRPLTHVSLDVRDEEALTPNHFLIGSSSGEVNLGHYDPKNVCLKKQWRIAQKFADAFWKRWLKEFLPSLLPRSKWTQGGEPIAVNDIVLIMDSLVRHRYPEND